MWRVTPALRLNGLRRIVLVNNNDFEILVCLRYQTLQQMRQVGEIVVCSNNEREFHATLQKSGLAANDGVKHRAQGWGGQTRNQARQQSEQDVLHT